MRRRLISIALVATTACAETLPGEVPPLEQTTGDDALPVMHFPLGLTVVPGANAAADRLIVNNTNFDQRFNAATLLALSVDELIAKIRGTTDEVGLFDELPVRSGVKVHDFGGRLLAVPRSDGSTDVFVPSRGRNRLTRVVVKDGALSCSTPNVEPLRAVDCTQAYVVHTGGSDPFSVVHIPDSTEGLLAVGHLRPSVTRVGDSNRVTGTVSLVDLETFTERARIEERNVGKSDADRVPYVSPVVAVQLSGVPGVAGLAAIQKSGAEHGIFVAGRDGAAGVTLPLSDFNLTRPDNRFDLSEQSRLFIGRETRAVESRGLIYDAARQRLFVSLRFFEPGDASNSGIATVALEGDTMRVLSIVEVGEEIGQPVLRMHGTPPRPLLYVTDIHTDQIYIVDVTADLATVVAQIGGRWTDGGGQRRELLDAPAEIVFVERHGVGFVSNFGNATIAVLDVSDPNPTRHRVVARFGPAVRSDGSVEGEE